MPLEDHNFLMGTLVFWMMNKMPTSTTVLGSSRKFGDTTIRLKFRWAKVRECDLASTCWRLWTLFWPIDLLTSEETLLPASFSQSGDSTAPVRFAPSQLEAVSQCEPRPLLSLTSWRGAPLDLMAESHEILSCSSKFMQLVHSSEIAT